MPNYTIRQLGARGLDLAQVNFQFAKDFQSLVSSLTDGHDILFDRKIVQKYSAQTQQLNAPGTCSIFYLLHSQATKAFSKTWQQRESALLEVHNEMQQLPPSSDKAQSMMHACIILINKSIRDKVSAVCIGYTCTCTHHYHGFIDI